VTAAGLVAEAFALGLSSGPVCLASCSPVLLPVLAAERRPARKTGAVLAEFLAGRLGGYLAFATLAWLAGFALPATPKTRAMAFGAADLALAVLLAAYAVSLGRKCAAECPAAKARRFTNRFGALAPLCLGIVTGFSLCPPFVAAGIRAAQSAGLGRALLFFACFFAGTSIWFAPALSVALLRRIEAAATVARFVLFLLAAYYGYLTFIVWGGLLVHGS
jgi:hypothetical protein